jgi:hypothetical protein
MAKNKQKNRKINYIWKNIGNIIIFMEKWFIIDKYNDHYKII